MEKKLKQSDKKTKTLVYTQVHKTNKKVGKNKNSYSLGNKKTKKAATFKNGVASKKQKVGVWTILL